MYPTPEERQYRFLESILHLKGEGAFKKCIAPLIRLGAEISPTSRELIADYLEGNIPLKRARKHSNIVRNWCIWDFVSELLKSGRPLTTTREENGAAVIVGEEFGLSEENVLKIYQRTDRLIKNDQFPYNGLG